MAKRLAKRIRYSFLIRTLGSANWQFTSPRVGDIASTIGGHLVAGQDAHLTYIR